MDVPTPMHASPAVPASEWMLKANAYAVNPFAVTCDAPTVFKPTRMAVTFASVMTKSNVEPLGIVRFHHQIVKVAASMGNASSAVAKSVEGTETVDPTRSVTTGSVSLANNACVLASSIPFVGPMARPTPMPVKHGVRGLKLPMTASAGTAVPFYVTSPAKTAFSPMRMDATSVAAQRFLNAGHPKTVASPLVIIVGPHVKKANVRLSAETNVGPMKTVDVAKAVMMVGA